MRGNYIANPDYKPCCIGVSSRDWAIIVSLFLLLWGFVVVMFIALLQFMEAVTIENGLWVFFAAWLFFLTGVGMAIFTGQREQAQIKALKDELAAAEQEDTSV